MIEFPTVGAQQIGLLVLGTILMIIVPLMNAIIWTEKKKERFTTDLAGAASFLLFAVFLEKPIQAVLVAPTQIGLADRATSSFINARPFWGVHCRAFPGYLLRNRTACGI